MKNSKPTRVDGLPIDTDYGIRKVSKMNFSFIVTLPKAFVQNIKNGKITKAVRMSMSKDGSLNLTPVFEKDEPAEFSFM